MDTASIPGHVRTIRLATWSAAALLCLMLAGCASTTTDTVVASPALTTGAGEATSDDALTLPGSIGVLPFDNRTRSEFAYEAVRRTMFNHFASKNYRLLHWRDVDRRLALAGVDPAEVGARSPAELRQILGVDGLLFGTITHYNKTFAGIYAQIAVGVDLTLMNRDDAVVWSVKNVKRSHASGVSTSPVGLLMNALVAAKHLYGDVELYRASDDLGRALAEQMPEPERMSGRVPPVITDVVHSGVGQHLKYGDTLEIALDGAAGLQAAASIEGIGVVDLKETSPGQYTGKLAIDKRHEVPGLAVTGRLVDEFGQASAWASPYGLLHVDNTPPTPVSGLVSTPFDGAVVLNWTTPAEEIAGYRIEVADTETGAGRDVRAVAGSGSRIDGLVNFEAAWVRVFALDRAGNESDRAQIRVMAAPDPQFATATAAPRTLPTSLTGVVRLSREGSPYFLTASSRISPSATVLIEPGVSIEVSPKAELTVMGELRTFGTADAPVSVSGAGGGGFDAFLVIQSEQNVEVAGLRVDGAGIPIQVRAGAPVIRDSSLVRSQFNALVIGGAARPVIENCEIAGARASGVIVEGQAQPVLRNNRFVSNEPFHLQNGSTYQIDARTNTWEPEASAMTILGDVAY